MKSIDSSTSSTEMIWSSSRPVTTTSEADIPGQIRHEPGVTLTDLILR